MQGSANPAVRFEHGSGKGATSSEWGRETTLSRRDQDLFGDLYLRFSFYDQYDSQPPPGANDNDYGTSIAVGWDI